MSSSIGGGSHLRAGAGLHFQQLRNMFFTCLEFGVNTTDFTVLVTEHSISLDQFTLQSIHQLLLFHLGFLVG